MSHPLTSMNVIVKWVLENNFSFDCKWCSLRIKEQRTEKEILLHFQLTLTLRRPIQPKRLKIAPVIDR